MQADTGYPYRSDLNTLHHPALVVKLHGAVQDVMVKEQPGVLFPCAAAMPRRRRGAQGLYVRLHNAAICLSVTTPRRAMSFGSPRTTGV